MLKGTRVDERSISMCRAVVKYECYARTGTAPRRVLKEAISSAATAVTSSVPRCILENAYAHVDCSDLVYLQPIYTSSRLSRNHG